MVTVMYVCPRCGQGAAVERGDGTGTREPEVPCAVCGAAMEPARRVCECGKELGSHGNR